MHSPRDNPPVAKLPFVLGDLALLATAALLAWAGPTPLDAATLLGVFACVALGAVLLVTPFLLDYSRRQDDLADDRQVAVEHLVKTAAAAAEQASIAANSLHQMSRDTLDALAAWQKRPDRDESAAAPVDLEPQLRAVQQGLTELKQKLDRPTPPPRPPDLSPVLEKQLAEINTQLNTLQTSLARVPTLSAAPTAGPEGDVPVAKKSPAKASEAKPAARRAAAKAARSEGDTPPLFAEGLLNADASLSEEDAPPLDDEPVAPKVTAPTSPPPSPQPARPSAAAPSGPGVAVDTSSPAPTKTTAKAAQATKSEDGVTRLTVTAYIGIGNKLYLRGDGPGLSPSEGVPLQFVSIGKWRWETEAATTPLKVSVWKNDETRCDELGEFALKPGQTHEATAGF